jgi:uncharacterized protein (UPF0332 family)
MSTRKSNYRRHESVVNRLYYASFHAAQAVLHTRGFDPTTHGGMVSIFGQEIVEKGEATRDDGQFLNNLQDERDTADYNYNYDSLGVDIEERFTRTEKFIADMEELARME